jgi:hypothetical protein
VQYRPRPVPATASAGSAGATVLGALEAVLVGTSGASARAAVVCLPGPQNPSECHLYFAEGCHLYMAATRPLPQNRLYVNRILLGFAGIIDRFIEHIYRLAVFA